MFIIINIIINIGTCYLHNVSASHGILLPGSLLLGTAGSPMSSRDASVISRAFIVLSWLHSRSTTDCSTLLASFSACTLSITLNQITPESSYLHKCIIDWQLTTECAWSRDHATSSVTTVLPPPGQHYGTVCLNSFGKQTSPSDSSNDRWKLLCLVSGPQHPVSER